MTNAPPPYRSTPIFDENTLPAGLRKEHRTKAGVWAVIRLLEGRLRYRTLDPDCETILDPAHSGLILPEQAHFVEPLGVVRLQIDFYDHHPELDSLLSEAVHCQAAENNALNQHMRLRALSRWENEGGTPVDTVGSDINPEERHR